MREVGLPATLCALALLGQTESDLSFADPTPAPTTRDFAAELTRVVPSAPVLQLEAGDTVFVEIGLKLRRRAPDRVRAVPVAVKGDGATTAPWAEVRFAEGRRASIRYAVRARAEGRGPLTFTLELRDAVSDDTLGRVAVRHDVLVAPSGLAPADVDDNVTAYRALQARAAQAYEDLPELRDFLRLDRVDRAPSSARIPETKDPILQDFLRYRLLADVARQRLRAMADAADPTVAAAGARGIGRLSDGPTGVAKAARAIEGLTTGRALELARRALDRLQVDVAEGMLDKLRLSGTLERGELARAFALLGGVHHLRGRRAAAIRAYGGALCLDPEIRPAVGRRVLLERFEAAIAEGGCPEPIAVAEVVATREITDRGPRLKVQAFLTPDPFQVVSGGEIQLWGFGGAVERAARGSADHGERRPVIEVVLDEDLDSASSPDVLLKVLVRHRSGVELATFGHPDPRRVRVSNAEEIGDPSGTNWWVWLAVGGAAIVAAGAGVGIWAASGSSEVDRGIGPTTVRF